MEWELWVYITRVTSVRRVPQATVERVVGGDKAKKLIAPSPARVRRFLKERFSSPNETPQAIPTIQSSRDELGNGDSVHRAQQRFRRGDWAGAAAELVEAASRPFAALSQLFVPTYPEREAPLATPIETTLRATLEARPRSRTRDPMAGGSLLVAAPGVGSPANLPMPLLSDPEGTALRALGVYHTQRAGGGHVPRPSSLVFGPDGRLFRRRIVFYFRPSPAVLLADVRDAIAASA